ncbi:MAG: RecQ family ATP-dependent DNA helicase [Planctomycetota bacterium]
MKEVFPNIGVHAYTATATPAVREDIAAQLGLAEAEMLVGSFDRPNLTYRVRPASGKLQRIHEIAKRHAGESGVVYCISRKEVEKTAAALQELGVKAAPYHAGLTDERRQRTQEDFLNDRIEVIVATVAFGMGIDKPDVRFVCHAGMPKSLEAYQQEAGRAGRDGLPAECLLLFSRGDALLWKRIIENPNDGDAASPEAIEAALRALDGVTRYASGVTCRHRALVEHFGQTLETDNCEACDVCLNELDLVDDPLVLAQKIVSCVARLEQRYGADYTCKVLAGSSEERILAAGHDQLSTYGLLKSERASDVRDWVEQLVGQGFLVKAGEYGVLHLTPAGLALLKGEGSPRLLRAAKKPSTSRSGSSKRDTESWEGVDRDLFEELRQLRSQIAAELSVPAYVVFGDASLRDMARRRPSTMAGFGHTHGVGQKKLREYGETFLEAITAYCTDVGVAVDIDSDASPVTKRPAARRPSGPKASSLAAFPLFREGVSIDDAAAQLGRARSTTVGYLSDYLKQETVTDPTPWVDRGVATQIEGAIEEVGLSGLKPIHEQLGGEVDYDSIRIVATCVANRERE